MLQFLDKKLGAKRPREASENSPVAVKIKSKTQEKTSGTAKLSSISRYMFNMSEVDIKRAYCTLRNGTLRNETKRNEICTLRNENLYFAK